MIKRGYIAILIWAVAAAAATGCARDEGIYSQGIYQPSADAIGFGNVDDSSATKGAVYEQSSLDQMEVYAYYTAQNSWSAASGSSQVVPFMTAQAVDKVTIAESGTTYWYYTPTKYWPTADDDKITFFGFSPASEMECTYDATTAKPSFTYTMSQYSNENPDLLVATPLYDCTYSANGQSGVEFEFEHLLTRISIWGAISNDLTEGEYATQGMANVRYVVNGITFAGLHSKAEAIYDATAKEWTWSVADDVGDPTVDYVATQSKTLLAYDDPKAELTETSMSLSYDDDTDIFVLPQTIDDDMKIQVRVRMIYDVIDPDTKKTLSTDNELMYASADLAIPTPSLSGKWSIGDWIKLSFTFDMSKIDEYTMPVTISSEIMPWTTADVTVDINSNIYIYSSDPDVKMYEDGNDLYGNFMIYTNYAYNLRVPHHREELDYAITSSRGFLFCTEAFNAYDTSLTEHVGFAAGTYRIFVPTLLTEKDGDQIVYVTAANLKEEPYSSLDTSGFTIKEGSSNGYCFANYTNEDGSQYNNLLYYDPANNNAITEFKYYTEGDHEIDLTDFADASGTVYFSIIIGDIYQTGTPYTFDFSVRRQTRGDLGLYTSTGVGTDDSYGVNKSDDDPVYTLRLSVDENHFPSSGFAGLVGVEMISNGGGMITQLFSVTLTE